MQPTKVPVLNFVQQLQIMLQIMLYIYSYYRGTSTTSSTFVVLEY